MKDTPPTKLESPKELQPPMELSSENFDRGSERTDKERVFIMEEESRKRREEVERRRKEEEEMLRRRLQGKNDQDERPMSPGILPKSDEPWHSPPTSNYPFDYEEQLNKQQHIIDRLLGDLDRQTEALKKASDDVLELRSRNATLIEENLELKRKLKDTSQAPKIDQNAELQGLDSDGELKRKISIF
jgi:hypothetical protein